MGVVLSRELGNYGAVYVEPIWVNNSNPLPGNTLPTGLSADTAYTVATAPSSSTFTLTGVNVTTSGTCVVQRYVGKVVNSGDTVTINSGSVTVYAD